MWNIASGSQKLIVLIFKFYLFLPTKIKEIKLCQGTRDVSLDLLSTCLPLMEFRFDAMLCSNLGKKRSDAGHIKCLRRLQVPHP